jgi:hypothetical protein
MASSAAEVPESWGVAPALISWTRWSDSATRRLEGETPTRALGALVREKVFGVEKPRALQGTRVRVLEVGDPAQMLVPVTASSV